MENWKNQFFDVKEIESKPGGKIILPAKHGIPVKREKNNARSNERNSNRRQ